MPIIPEVIETFDKLKKLHELKNDDYTGDKGVFYNFEFAESLSNAFPSPDDRVYATIIGIKLARLSVLLDKSPNFETVEDTFDDAIVYLAIWKANYIARNKK